MKPIQIGHTDSKAVLIDPLRLVDTRALIQGNSGAGKSWLIRLIAEQTIGKIQTVIIDPESEFHTLREQHDLLLISHDGEVKPHVKTAGLLARKLCELNVSAVLDIFDLQMAERRKFVRLFIESLMAVPRSLWHPMLIVIDEAHLFAPEKSAGEAESLNAIISLMSQGRKRGFAGVLATQRFSKLHKDAAAECNNVMIGRTWLDIDQQRAVAMLGIGSSQRNVLRDLAQGEFFGFGPSLNLAGVTRFQAGQVQTTHPEAGKRHNVFASPPSDAIKRIVSALTDLPEQAETEAKTLADAQKRIAALERELRAKPKPQADESAIGKAVYAAEQRLTTAYTDGLKKMERDYRSTIARMKDRLTKIAQLAGGEMSEVPASVPEPTIKAAPLPRVAELKPAPVAIPKAIVDNGQLGKGELAILTVAAQYPDGATREQMTILTGYKRSSRDAYIQRLKAAGYVKQRGDLIYPTGAGIAALGADFEPLPTGRALQEYWLARLPEGEKRFLAFLLDAYPGPVTRQELGNATDYQRSSRDAYLQRLKARKLIVDLGGGNVKASNVFFE